MDLWKSILFAIIVVACGVLVTYFLKKNRMNKLIALMQSGNKEEFMKVANSKTTAFLFPRFNIEYLKLSYYILEGNKRKVNETFDFLLSMKLPKKQKQDVTMRAFNYYVDLNDKDRTKKLLETINTFDNAKMKQEATMVYDIFIMKRGNHIEEVLEQMEYTPEEAQGVNEYLLYVQYKNIGDKENEKKYEKLYKEHTKMPEDIA